MVATVLQSSLLSVTSLGSVASIVGLLVALYTRRGWVRGQWERLTGKRESEIKAEAKAEFLDDIFGRDTAVELLTDGKEYGQRIEAAAEDATRIRRLSGNLEGQENMDDYEQFCDSDVEKQLLVIRPDGSDDPMGEYSGNELMRHLKTSRDSDARPGRLEGTYQRLRRLTEDDGDWENVEIRSYLHTPWIRMASYEDVHGNQEAGFTFSPTVADFRDTPLFWTTDSDVIAALNSIYDDIWTDERTVRLAEEVE